LLVYTFVEYCELESTMDGGTSVLEKSEDMTTRSDTSSILSTGR